MRNIKNNLTAAGTFLAGVVGHHYVSKLLDYKSEMEDDKDQILRDDASTANMV